MVTVTQRMPGPPRGSSLPFPAQHRILLLLQRRLERSTFEFIRKRLPQLSQSKGWDCAEKLELHMAFRELEQEFRACPTADWVSRPKGGFGRLRADIISIRHAAVHRQPQSQRRLRQQLTSASEYATVWLGDRQCGLEIRQCQALVNDIFDDWRERCCRLRSISMARMDYDGGRCSKNTLLEATRRLTDKIDHDCIEQVDRVLHASFPPPCANI
ncbi:hypothetical protein BJX63DRAFT_443116 [Aspergillus granulosus]|uniref:Uncharacterized protein n=1 Tax=Aspergillus granulosus TaxID=176169 RepID=A0ABR4GR02_9EURO